MTLTARIGKAARLLDLRGDTHGAMEILRGVLSDPAIEQHIPQKVEALVFLAELHWHIGERDQAIEYLRRLGLVNLAVVEPDLVGLHLRRAEHLRAALVNSAER